MQKMSLSWGVTPLLVELKHNSDELFDHAVDKAEEMGLIKQGEIVVLTAGVPLGISGTTNMIKVHVAGHILMRGKGLNDKVDSRQYVCGKLRRGTEREIQGWRYYRCKRHL